ncbi:MAG: extensin family protein [Sulfitobacter sp.]
MRFLYLGILLAVFGSLGYVALTGPETPLPDAWNPTKPLHVTHEYTPLTQWKLTRALNDRQACLAALGTGAQITSLPDFGASAQCHIKPQVRLSAVGQSSLNPVNTRCQTALRMAMWEHHGIQPAAQAHLGAAVGRVAHFSSYSCRAIRTPKGSTTRMSTHATADAIDVSGFILDDGREISLKRDWNGDATTAAFLRDVRDSACEWFRVTLSPDYNTLHADHFHLQHTGWGLCR